MEQFCKVCGYDQFHDVSISDGYENSKSGSVGAKLDFIKGSLSKTQTQSTHLSYDVKRCNFCLNTMQELFTELEPIVVKIPPNPDLILSSNVSIMTGNSESKLRDLIEEITKCTRALRKVMTQFQKEGKNVCKCDAVGIKLKVRLDKTTIEMRVAIDNEKNEFKYRIIYGGTKVHCPN